MKPLNHNRKKRQRDRRPGHDQGPKDLRVPAGPARRPNPSPRPPSSPSSLPGETAGNGTERTDHPVQGVLELHPKGYGFLRNAARDYVAQQADPYVPEPLIRKFGLREGLLLAGPLELSRKGSTGPRLARIDRIEGLPPDEFRRPNFD